MPEAVDESAAPPPLSSPVASGADQTGVRLYNERLILSLVRRFGQLSKIEVARMTGLSVQSTSAIMNRLQVDGLLASRGAVARTRRPADGSGLARSRRRVFARPEDRPPQLRSRPDRLLRRMRRRAHRTYAYPTPNLVMDFVMGALEPMTQTLTPAQRRRIAGLGVASPFQLWNWSAEIGAPAEEMDAWRSFSIEEELARSCPYPVTLCNDATSACAAEFFFGEAWRHRDFLYFFLGAFVGGGLVLDGALYPGRTGNAAALGSMPIAPQDASRQRRRN